MSGQEICVRDLSRAMNCGTIVIHLLRSICPSAPEVHPFGLAKVTRRRLAVDARENRGGSRDKQKTHDKLCISSRATANIVAFTVHGADA